MQPQHVVAALLQAVRHEHGAGLVALELGVTQVGEAQGAGENEGGDQQGLTEDQGPRSKGCTAL